MAHLNRQRMHPMEWGLLLIAAAIVVLLLFAAPPVGLFAAVLLALIVVVRRLNFGGARENALWRLIGVIYAVTIYPFVVMIGAAAGALYFVLEIASGIVLGRRLSATDGGGIAGVLTRLFRWPIKQIKWLVLGEPDRFPLWP